LVKLEKYPASESGLKFELDVSNLKTDFGGL